MTKHGDNLVGKYLLSHQQIHWFSVFIAYFEQEFNQMLKNYNPCKENICYWQIKKTLEQSLAEFLILKTIGFLVLPGGYKMGTLARNVSRLANKHPRRTECLSPYTYYSLLPVKRPFKASKKFFQTLQSSVTKFKT